MCKYLLLFCTCNAQISHYSNCNFDDVVRKSSSSCAGINHSKFSFNMTKRRRSRKRNEVASHVKFPAETFTLLRSYDFPRIRRERTIVFIWDYWPDCFSIELVECIGRVYFTCEYAQFTRAIVMGCINFFKSDIYIQLR